MYALGHYWVKEFDHVCADCGNGFAAIEYSARNEAPDWFFVDEVGVVSAQGDYHGGAFPDTCERSGQAGSEPVGMDDVCPIEVFADGQGKAGGHGWNLEEGEFMAAEGFGDAAFNCGEFVPGCPQGVTEVEDLHAFDFTRGESVGPRGYDDADGVSSADKRFCKMMDKESAGVAGG